MFALRPYAPSLVRRLLIGLLALHYLLLGTGVEWLIIDSALAWHKTVSEDFPCAGHNCGCLTAQQCRDHCCCAKPKPSPKPKRSCCAAAESEADEKDCTPVEVRHSRRERQPVRVTVMGALECGGRAEPANWFAGKSLSHHLPTSQDGTASQVPEREEFFLPAQEYDDFLPLPPDQVPRG